MKKRYSDFQKRVKYRFSKPQTGILTPEQDFRIDHYTVCLPSKGSLPPRQVLAY